MHALVSREIMPEQTSYRDRHFDVLTCAAAMLAALVATSVAGRRLVMAWSIGGPDRLNVFVTCPPFVWLPAVLVPAALAGPLIIFRTPNWREP